MRPRRSDSSSQLQQKPERLVRDAVLGVVQVDADRLDRHPLSALGVFREELAKRKLFGLLVMCLQGLPGGPL